MTKNKKKIKIKRDKTSMSSHCGGQLILTIPCEAHFAGLMAFCPQEKALFL